VLTSVVVREYLRVSAGAVLRLADIASSAQSNQDPDAVVNALQTCMEAPTSTQQTCGSAWS